jgi:hypothetical protein
LRHTLKRENLSHEFQVVLAGLQAHLKTAPEPDWTQVLVPSLDWQQVLRLCQFHEVTPLVYESLSLHARDLPPEALTGLKQQVLKDQKKSLHLTRVLTHLLGTFQREGIAVLPYKGVVLSHHLFGDVAKRPTKDLDIVVQRQNYGRTKEVLLNQGFTGPFLPSGNLATGQQEKLILEGFHHHVFRGRATNVELHFDIMPPSGHRSFRLTEVWPQLDDSTFVTHPVKSLPHDLLFFVLSTHAAIHYWKRLKWLFDGARLLDHAPLSANIVERAKLGQREAILFATALLSHVLLGLPLPDAVQTSVRTHSALHNLGRTIVSQYQPWPHGRIHGLQEFRCRMWLSDSFNVSTVFTSLHHKLVTGGYYHFSAPKFAYTFLNPLRLTSKFVGEFFRK